MSGTEECRILPGKFSIQQSFTHSNFAEDGRSRGSIEPEPPRLVAGIDFMTRPQFELVEASRMDDGMAANSRASRFQLSKSFEVGLEEKGLAVGVVHILGLNEKSAPCLIRLLDPRKVQSGSKRVLPIHIMGQQQGGPLASGDCGQAHPVLRVVLIPCSQDQQPNVRAWFKSIHIVTLGLIVAIVLAAQHNIQQTQSEEIHLPLANRVRQQRGRAVVKARQHLGAGIRNVPITPDNFREVIATQTNFALLGAIQILHHRIRRRQKREVITFARSCETAKTEERLNASPKHVLREDESTLPYECG